MEIIFLSFLKICQCLSRGDESVCNSFFELDCAEKFQNALFDELFVLL